MSEIKKSNKRNRIIIEIIAVVLIAFLAFAFRNSFLTNPFAGKYTFDGPTNVFAGKTGQLYVIDRAKKRVVVTDEELKYRGELVGGSTNRKFFYASLVCDDESGNIYVADVVYSGHGTQIAAERIQKFNRSGNYIKTIYEITYDEGENAPFQYGNIHDMRVENGCLSFVVTNDESMDLYQVKDGDDKPTLTSFKGEYDINDVAYDALNNQMIICERQGDIVTLDKYGKEKTIYYGHGKKIPWKLAVDQNGDIFFTEAVSGNIYQIHDGKSKVDSRIEGDRYDTIHINDQGMMVSTDFAGVFVKQQGQMIYYDSLSVQNLVLRCLLWILVGVSIILILALLYTLVDFIVGTIKNRELMIRGFIVLATSLVCAVTITTMMYRNLNERHENLVMRELSYVGSLLIDGMDTSKIERIQSISDYKNKDYTDLKNSLDHKIRMGYDIGSYYYYVIYVHEGDTLNALMDFEETSPIDYPVYEWGDNIYTACVLDKEEKRAPREASSYGSWAFVLEPICNDKGDVVGVLEVGCDLDEMDNEKNKFFIDILFATGTAVVVIIMLLMEVLFMLGDKRNAKDYPEHPVFFVPLRMTVFLIYLADSLQDAFVVQLCNRLYDGSLPISKGLASSLPIAIELFMAAAFSLIVGRIVGKVGTKKMLIIGSIISMVGFFLCGAWGGYYVILIGKALVGIGMGTVYVSANTLAAMGSDEGETGKAFAGIAAGVISGITVGDGLGSLILAFASYRVVYVMAGLIMLSCVVMMFRGRDYKAELVRDKTEINLVKFLCNVRVLPFLLLLLLPFMVMLSYREYFFPLYAEENGMNEVAIGRLFLICGLIVIYVGPALGEFLLQKIGSKKSVVLASALLLIDILIFVVFPGFIAAVIGIIILSIDVSFAYSCQYAYFTSLPESDRYGEGNSLGIYSMIENAGQTVGPLVFGSALVLGYRAGIGMIGVAYGALLALFAVSLLFSKKEKAKK